MSQRVLRRMIGLLPVGDLIKAELLSALARDGEPLVAGQQIVDLLVDNAMIADLAVSNAKIEDLDAAKVTAGFLDADRIDARSLRVDKLMIGSVDNLIQNPGFEDATLDPHSSHLDGGGTWVRDTAIPRSGGAHLTYRFPAGGMTGDAVFQLNGDRLDRTLHPAAAEGDVVYFEAWCKVSGVNGTHDARVQIRFMDETGAEMSGSTSALVTLTTTYQKLTLSLTAPAGVAYAVMRFVVVSAGSSSTAGSVLFDDCYARRKVGTLVIEDVAVDIDRMLDPIHVASAFDRAAEVIFNSDVDTVLGSVTLNNPGWAGTASVISIAQLHVLNADDSTLRFIAHVRNGDSVGDEAQTAASTVYREALGVAHITAFAAPGSAVTVEFRGRWSIAHTNNSTVSHQLSVQAIWER